nr:hypothetical protein [Tanacetum cinerariifolium]
MLPLDFANENRSQQSTGGNRPEDQGQEAVAPEVPPPENVMTTRVAPEAGQAEGIDATGPHVIKERRKRGMGSTRPVPASRCAPVDVSDPDPLDPQSLPTSDVAQSLSRPGGSHSTTRLPLKFEQEAKLLKKSVAQVALRDKRIQAREDEIKNLETLLEAETDMKKTVSTLQAQVTGEEKLKAAFEEFKQYEDNRVEKRCAEMNTRLDVLSIGFDKELYPHMLTAIAGRIWVIRHGLRLTVMKCGESTELRHVFADVVSAGIAKGMSEGLQYGVEHGKANLSLEAIEAYDPEGEAKYIAALHDLKDLKYPIVDQLNSLKDALMDVIMTSLHLESDTEDDAPQWIRELRPSSSQLKIPVYPEVRDPTDPWACKEEILLADAIAANVSRAKKKKKCRVVCRTHGVGSAYQARSDSVSVSVPTVAPQGLAILLADAATQTKTSEDGASPRVNKVNTAKGKVVVNAVKGNVFNTVKDLAFSNGLGPQKSITPQLKIGTSSRRSLGKEDASKHGRNLKQGKQRSIFEERDFDVQAMLDVDYGLVARLRAEEQRRKPLTKA